MRAQLSLLALVLLGACGAPMDGDPESEPVPAVTMIGDTALLELPLGRSAENGEISIGFDAVTEDSRCPRGVQCVREGNAGVRLTLQGGEETGAFVLNSAVEPRSASYGGYSIALRDLAPYPVDGEPLDREAYVARIAVVETR